MKIRQVKCIYTKHLTKKRKLWNDGILKIINMSGTIHCELSDALSTRGIPLESRQLDKREVLKFRDTEDFELELENYIVSVSRLDNSASDAASGTKLPEPPLKLPKFIPPSRYVPINRVESRSNKAVPVNDSKVSTYNKYQVTSDELDDLWGNHHDDDTTTTAEKSQQHPQYDDRSHAPMHTQSLKSNHSRSNMEHSDKGNNNYNNNSNSYSRGQLEHYSNNTKSNGGDYHTNNPRKSYGNSNAMTNANRGDDDDDHDDVNHSLKTAYRTTGAAPAGCLEAFTSNPSRDKTSNTARNQHPTSRFTSNNVPNCNNNSNITSQNQQRRRSEGTTCEYEKISISADHNRRNDDDLQYIYNGDVCGNDFDEEDKSNQQRRLVFEHDPPQHMDHSRGRRKETTRVAASSSSSSSSYRQPSLLPSVGIWDDDDGNDTENHTYNDGSVSYNRSNDLLLSSSTQLIGYDIHRDRQRLAHADIITSVQHDYHDGDGNASSSWNMFDTSIWNND